MQEGRTIRAFEERNQELRRHRQQYRQEEVQKAIPERLLFQEDCPKEQEYRQPKHRMLLYPERRSPLYMMYPHTA